MVQLAYHNRHTYHSPSIQGLKAIDQPNDVRYAPVIDKYDGDRVFKANAVVEHFGEFQDVKRYTQNDWETLPRYPAEIPTFDGVETAEAFPAYPEELLYVARQGLTSQAPDINPIEVSGNDGMASFPDPSLQGDFSNLPFSNSDSNNSNYNSLHSMANMWTLNQLDMNARLQPPFFVLPKGPLPSADKIDPSSVQLLMYLLCVNPRTEHGSVLHFSGVPGAAVKRPAEFLRRFSAALLWGLQTLKDSLIVLETGLGDDQAEYTWITTLLQSELGLSSSGDVKPLVEKMIDYLQELRQQDGKEQTLHNQATKSRPPLSRHDIAVLPSYLEKHPDTLQDDTVHQGLFHVCDSQGREQLMCRSCYRLLYPLYSTQYIMSHVGAHGDYSAQKGSIVLRPQDSKDLQQLCLLDTAKVGCVTELIIDLSWDVSTEDTQAIHALAGRLGLTSLTIATTALAPSDSTSSLSPPLAPSSNESSGSQLEKIKKLSLALLQGLKQLCISSHLVLNAPALLFELRRLPPQKNVLVVMIKEPSSRCFAGLYHGNIQLLDLGTTLYRVKVIATIGYFAGNLQSITISLLELKYSENSLLTDDISTILRKNPNLSLLTFYCDARDFRMMEDMMESIYSKMTSEQAPASRLSIYNLIDNSDNHVFASFRLPNSRENKAIVANVTTRNNISSHLNFLMEYGMFIRTLNTNHKSGIITIAALSHTLMFAHFSQLRNITISVGDLNWDGAMHFSKILRYPSATLKQLVLVGASVDSHVSGAVVHALKRLRSIEVVCFDDGSNTKQWVDKVQDSLPEGNSLTVLDRVDDLRRVVPGHDNTSLDWLRTRQAKHFSTGTASHDASASSQPPSISSPVKVQQGYQPTVDWQPFRALENPKSTIDTTAPSTGEIHAREEFEVPGDKNHPVPLKTVQTTVTEQKLRAYDSNPVFQRFQVPEFKSSLKILPVQRHVKDGFYSVRVRAIERAYEGYSHILRAPQQDVEVSTVQEEPVPLRIRAYPDETLRVIYAEGTQYQLGDASEEGGEGGGGGEYEDTMDDFYNMYDAYGGTIEDNDNDDSYDENDDNDYDNDDNYDNYDHDGPETEGDDMDWKQSDVAVDYSSLMEA
ncbi:hypothetical protein BGZ88_008434 [Linnemannia elongata]|nr:hypothetical protein BGZ88_008434 [Linnemannia elongata]